MDSATLSCSITNPNEPNTPPKSFAFDGVYGTDSTTEAIYNDNGFALVEVDICIYVYIFKQFFKLTRFKGIILIIEQTRVCVIPCN